MPPEFSQELPLYRRAGFQQVAGAAWRPGGPELTRRALALAACAPAARVLDVGCGAGATLDVLQAAGLRGVGLDASCSLPPCGRSAEARPPFVLGDGGDLPFRDGAFDALICECVLSLLEDPAAVLRGFARVLGPRACLILTDMYVRGTRGGGSQPAVEQRGKALGAAEAPVRRAGSSCLAGAMPRAEVERMLAQAGLRLRIFEDHSARLKELAARLIWYGGADVHARDLLGAGTACVCGSGARYGYGLWIAEKIADA